MTLVPEPEGCASKLMKALRVLVVEDDALIAMLLTEMLAGMGHNVCATPATEAVTLSLPTTLPSVYVIVARPSPPVVVDVPPSDPVPLPRAHETMMPETALPNWSVTIAPKSRVPPTATVVAGASMAIPTGGPATSATVIVRETVPSVAVSCTEAGVVVMGAWYRMVRPSGVSSKMLPVPVVVHRTSPSGFALPYASRTVAAITDWESTDTLVDVSAMSNVAGAPGTMVTCCRPVLPLEWVAVTKPTPTVVDAVNTPADYMVVRKALSQGVSIPAEQAADVTTPLKDALATALR